MWIARTRFIEPLFKSILDYFKFYKLECFISENKMTINSDFFFSSIFKSSKSTELPRYVVFTDAKLTPSIPAETNSFILIATIGDFNNDHLDDVIMSYGDTYTKPLLYLSNGDAIT